MFDEQAGIVSRRQALASGLTPAAIRSRIDSGRWQIIGRGVYATFTGPLPRMAQLWAALLNCGAGATLSHQSAGELLGLIDDPHPVVHVTMPIGRRIRPVQGVIVHYSSRLSERRHPTRQPPTTRVDETVLDLVEDAKSLNQAIALLSAAVGRRLTTVEHLRKALDRRSRIRWRVELTAALSDVEAGCHSLLEIRYLRDVERAHGLQAGQRQAKIRNGARHLFRDVRYNDFALVVELDGRLAHPAESRNRDHQRDNVESRNGGAVLHYGWGSVTETPCMVAAEVATALRARGWPGHLRRCGRNCGALS